MENSTQDPKFAKFHSIDREKIDWHPVVDESKCIGCDMCATSCGRGVYKFDYKNKKSKVINPNNCMVTCITCLYFLFIFFGLVSPKRLENNISRQFTI
jgi:ferredoxin